MRTELILENKVIKLTHLEKILFPKSQISKGRVIEYYFNHATYILNYIKDRPLTLQRFPNGIIQPGFFQKHAESFPEWIERIELPSQKGPMQYILVSRKEHLAYFTNLNTIAFHSALSTVRNIYQSDTILLDLDPSDDNFNSVMQVAFMIKKVTDELKIHTQLKTTGSRGLHIYIPLKKLHDFKQTHAFAKKFSQYLTRKHPDHITTTQSKDKRGKKVFIDYARNSYGLTAVAPYSLRAKEGAPIATPIEWAELGKNVLSSMQFTLENIDERLSQKGDIWENAAETNDLDMSILDS